MKFLLLNYKKNLNTRNFLQIKYGLKPLLSFLFFYFQWDRLVIFKTGLKQKFFRLSKGLLKCFSGQFFLGVLNKFEKLDKWRTKEQVAGLEMNKHTKQYLKVISLTL